MSKRKEKVTPKKAQNGSKTAKEPTSAGTSSVKKKRSLADELFDLASPAPKPDFDPEDAQITSSWKPRKEDDEEDDEEETEDRVYDQFEDAPRVVGQQSLRDISLLEGKYAGKVVSRKRLEDDSDEQDEEDNEDEEMDGMEEDDSEEDGFGFGMDDSSNDDEDAMEEEEPKKKKSAASKTKSNGGDDKLKSKKKIASLFKAFDYDSDDVDGEDNEDDDGEDDDDESGFVDSDDEEDGEDNDSDDDEEETTKGVSMKSVTMDEADRLQRELEEEEAQVALTSIKSETDEFEKATHARNQKILQTAFLDTRIRLQTPLTLANRLPQPGLFQEFSKNKQVKSKLQEVTTNIMGLMSDLLHIQTALKDQNEAVTSGVKSKKRKLSDISGLSDLWERVQSEENELKEFEEDTIEKWHKRTQLASGQHAGKQFKAVNQSVFSQVNQVLEDKERLIKRTNLRRTPAKVFGKPQIKEEEEKKELTHDAHLEDYDEEIFDDTDFYQQILTEVIQSGTQELDSLAYMEYLAESSRLRKKNRKQVDRRASKGRKIRYNTHEKLVGFMAPKVQESFVEDQTWRSQELFATLFGQKTN